MAMGIGGREFLDLEQLRLRGMQRLLRSRVGLRAARAVARRRVPKPHDRVSWDFYLALGERLYAGRDTPAVWSNIFFPGELIWGLGLVPFYPELAAAIAAAFGLTSLGVESADVLGYPVDLCTVNRSAAGLRAAGFYPRADAYVTSSHVCDATSQILTGLAHARGGACTLIDVPQSQDEAAVDYVTRQLEDLVDRWTAELGITYDPERMRRAIRLSNQARALALEVAALRESRPAPVRGSSMLGLLSMLTTMLGHPSGVAYYRALRDYVRARIEQDDPEQTQQQVRVYWMHLRPYFRAELMSHLEDARGVVIAAEETSTVWWEALDEEQPLRSLARKMVSNYFNGPVERRMALALHHIERYQCVGAIHFSHWGCRQSAGALRIVRDRLRRAGVPLLVLDGDCIDPTNLALGPLQTRIDAFVEMLV